MKLDIDAKTLADAIKTVTSHISKRASDVHQHVRVDRVDAWTVSFTGADDNTTVTVNVAAQTTADRPVAMPSTAVQACIKGLSGLVMLTWPNTDLTAVFVEHTNGTTKIETRGIKSLTHLAPVTLSAAAVNVNVVELRRIIDTAAPAMSTEEERYYLNGVFLHPVDGVWRATASNGRILQMADMDMPLGLKNPPAVIVNRYAVAVMQKMLKKAESAQVEITKARTTLRVGGATAAARNINAPFPDYERVIPQRSPHTVTVDPTALMCAVMVALAGEKSSANKPIPVAVTIHPDKIEVAHKAVASISASCNTPKPITIGFNAAYLLSVLRPFADVVAIVFDDAASFVVLATPDGAARCVIVPMRL